MHISDYEQALQLWQSLPGMGLSSADEKENIREFLQKNPGTCFVALKDENLIGTILGGSDGRRGYIYHLAVQQTEQKIGVGKKLMYLCLNEFKKSGIQKCHIFVISDNAEGIAFWENVGWQPRDDILVMSKEIKD
jgi:ribosomal protein S18 acetylase RimI-like enzyme